MASDQESSERDDDQGVSAEIARSLGAVWQRFSGSRPKTLSVEVKTNVVRCVIEENPEKDVVDGDDAPAAGGDVGSTRFGYDATAVVARATHQRVVAFIPKRDGKTQTVTQTYILDRPRQRF